ncbi:hypothetical protein [Mycobacterium leprae]|uniref:hypothetical protein n=1 Tax=Mycobacterium leprae TaxID=1769 RepID=UPI001E354C4E|nr:hypothetical protein [Mycobacterium leprae]
MLAALGMLEARHITGVAGSTAELLYGVRSQWRSGICCRMDELVDIAHVRWERCLRIAERAESDLKSGGGGLGDVQLFDALAVAQLIDRPRHTATRHDRRFAGRRLPHPAQCPYRVASGIWSWT